MKLYFMGICGTAMGNAALLLRSAGHEVLGADAGVYPPMSDVLRQAGIEAHEGYDPERLKRLAPDLVVIGNAMSRGNPEVEWLLDERAIPYVSLPALLRDLILRTRRNVVICGTHGKTTTTAITAHLLAATGADPGYLIGGVPQDPPTGNHLGAPGAPFVIEGDEYDSAFFDKRSKFIHYDPEIAVLNNLEFDHADIFRDLADVQRTFSHLARLVPRSGWILLNGDDDNLRALGPMAWTRALRVGMGEKNDLRIEGFREDAAGSAFRLSWRGSPCADVRWRLSGEYNARNAAMGFLAAVLAVLPRATGVRQADALQVDFKPPMVERLAAALAGFRGVRRRQEVLLASDRLTVVEDFGHHPTALAETLRSYRARYPAAILTAVFEPRSNTARTRALQAGFMRALATADEVHLGAVSRADKLAPEDRFDAEAVIEQLGSQGVDAFTAATNAALCDRLIAQAGVKSERSRVVVFFTNGSFDGIMGRFVKALT